MAEEGHGVDSEVAPGPAAAALLLLLLLLLQSPEAAAPAAARQGASTASPPSTGKEQIHKPDVTDRLFNDILFLGVAHR